MRDASQRRRADRHGIEDGKHLAQRLSEVTLDDGDGLLGREGRDLIEHLTQLGTILVRQHVGAQ
jgi:hypothetical protein